VGGDGRFVGKTTEETLATTGSLQNSRPASGGPNATEAPPLPSTADIDTTKETRRRGYAEICLGALRLLNGGEGASRCMGNGDEGRGAGRMMR
jgi:hypothetical protein